MEKKTSIKELKGKARLEYIWDYYKLPIFAVIAGVALVIYLIVHYVTYKDPVLEIYLVNSISSATEDTTDSTADFFEQEGLSAKDQAITVDTSILFTEDTSSTTNYYSNQTLTVKFAVGGGDILFAPDYVFDGYAGTGCMMPLTEILTDEELQKYSDILIYATDEETGDSYPCGVSLTDNAWLLDNGFYSEGDTLSFAVGYNARNPEIAKDFFRYILNYVD